MSIKKAGFKFKFDDLVEAVFRRATVLRASGAEVKAPKKPETAKIAAARSTQPSYGHILNSPEKTQHRLPERPTYSFCSKSHESVKCMDLLALPIQKLHEEIRRRNLCFKCLTTGHVERDCNTTVECSKCKRASQRSSPRRPLHPNQQWARHNLFRKQESICAIKGKQPQRWRIRLQQPRNLQRQQQHLLEKISGVEI